MIISQLKSLVVLFCLLRCCHQHILSLCAFSPPADSSQTSSAKKRKRIRKKFSAKKRLRLFNKAERMKSGGESGESAAAAAKPQLKDRKKK